MKREAELNGNQNGVFLNFWDSNEGNDVVFKITPNQAYRQVWSDEGNAFPEEPVNLIDELIKLSKSP